MLVIAHRIDTIMDCDQLLVLSDGQLVEQGNPLELSQRSSSTFGAMVGAAKASALMLPSAAGGAVAGGGDGKAEGAEA